MQNTRTERERFAAAIGKVALLTAKGEKPDKTILRLYWVALASFEIGTIEDVADEIIRTETELYTVPPPAKWAEVARGLFELRSRQQRRRPGDARCDVCDGTGYRIGYDGLRRFAEVCRHDGTPNDEPPVLHRVVSMFDLEGEIGPPEAHESELARKRREHGNLILHCLCCGEPYRNRLGRRCVCRTPDGFTSVKWLAMGHKDCPNPLAAGKGNTRCRNHCGCTPEQRNEIRPRFFPVPEPGQHVDAFLKEQGLRDANAPGPDDEPRLEEPTEIDDDLGF